MAASAQPDQIGHMMNTDRPETAPTENTPGENTMWSAVLNRSPGDFLYAVHHHGRLLPPRLPLAPAAAQERPLLPLLRRGRGRRLPRLQALRPERRARAASPRRWCAMPAPSSRQRTTSPRWTRWPTRSGYSRFHFLRMFRDHTGLTPAQLRRGRARPPAARRARRRRPRGRRGGRGRLRLGKPGL